MKKMLFFVLTFALLFSLGSCRQEEIPETPLRALTCDGTTLYKTEVGIDIDLRLYKDYKREEAEPVRVLKLFDREWQLTYKQSQRHWVTDYDTDLYTADTDNGDIDVWYIAGTEQMVQLSFPAREKITFWKPADFTPDEKGCLAYVYRICDHYGIVATDYIAEYTKELDDHRITLSKYWGNANTSEAMLIRISEEGYLDLLILPLAMTNTECFNKREIELFTDENIINAIKRRIEPHVMKGVRLTNIEIKQKDFFWQDGKLYMLVFTDVSYEHGKNPTGMLADFVVEIAQ